NSPSRSRNNHSKDRKSQSVEQPKSSGVLGRLLELAKQNEIDHPVSRTQELTEEINECISRYPIFPQFRLTGRLRIDKWKGSVVPGMSFVDPAGVVILAAAHGDLGKLRQCGCGKWICKSNQKHCSEACRIKFFKNTSRGRASARTYARKWYR